MDNDKESSREAESSSNSKILSNPKEIELELLSGSLASIQELAFAFRRAASRLAEMNSQEYISSVNRYFISKNSDSF